MSHRDARPSLYSTPHGYLHWGRLLLSLQQGAKEFHVLLPTQSEKNNWLKIYIEKELIKSIYLFFLYFNKTKILTTMITHLCCWWFSLSSNWQISFYSDILCFSIHFSALKAFSTLLTQLYLVLLFFTLIQTYFMRFKGLIGFRLNNTKSEPFHHFGHSFITAFRRFCSNWVFLYAHTKCIPHVRIHHPRPSDKH